MKTWKDIWGPKRFAFEEGLHNVDTLDLIGDWAWKECSIQYNRKLLEVLQILEETKSNLKKEDMRRIISILKGNHG